MAEKAAPRASLYEQAHKAILLDIMEGRLAPGEPIDRKAIARRLKMSVAPVHMAVNQLETEGLVVTLPRRGTHVRGYRPEDIRGHNVVRLALECQAASLYAGRRINTERETLIVPARTAQRTDQPTVDRIRCDVDFHRALVAAAGVPMLSDYFNRVMNVGLFLASCGMVSIADEPRDSHVQLLDDLCAASPRQAELRIRKHIEQKWKSRS